MSICDIINFLLDSALVVAPTFQYAVYPVQNSCLFLQFKLPSNFLYDHLTFVPFVTVNVKCGGGGGG